MRTILLVVLSSVSWSTSLAAQRLAVYGPASGGFVEVQPPMSQLQAVPAAIPPVLGYAAGPLLLPAAPPFGDCTFDNVLGHLWYSDGLTIAAMASPSVPPVAPLPAPVPIAPAVLAVTGRVTGMAIDGVTGVLFLCGLAGVVVGVLPNAAMPIVVPPFAIPWGTGPVSGLDWDGASGSLYAVDLAGVTYHFFPGGGPIGVPVAPPFVLPGPAGGVAIDRTLRPNAAGARPLFVAYGSQIVDVHDPQPVVFSGGVLGALGLAFLNAPAASPPNATCLCTGSTYPGPLFTTGPMTVGNAAFALGHGSLPPGFPMLFVFEVAGLVNTAHPWINAVGCGLGLVPGSAGLIVLTAIADPFGNAVLPLPLVGATLPVGTALYLQGATLCGADPVFGLVLTPTYTVYAASV
ncbi:MAG: hypothetical protein KF830_15540 [Planctomycetes bacterium]|nr:hypothetical protein [Planctomycetota bacterium]